MNRAARSLSMPAAQVRELVARPDAAPTSSRLAAAVDPDGAKPELHLELIALAVLRARQAAERAALGGETKAW